MTDGLELRFRLIEDVLAIQRLSYQYCRLIDSRLFHELSLLFAEDGMWIGQTQFDGVRNYTGVGRSPADIEQLLTTRIGENPPAPGATSYHTISAPEVELQGTRATGHLTWWQVQRSSADIPYVNLYGHYEDEYVNENGQWKFLKRVATIDIPFVVNELPTDI